MLHHRLGTASWLAILAIGSGGLAQSIDEKEIDRQNKFFQESWGKDLVWKFDELPTQGSVSKLRVPYSGHIYPDTHGGTINALRKYDRAYHGNRSLAAAWEQWDTTAQREPIAVTYHRRGFFGGGSYTVMQYGTPYWHGHCNGWAAAAIRHAEPKQSVTRNGVTFSPSDIKALLAEIYIYSDPFYLAGEYQYVVDPGTLHVMMANWIGRLSYPIAMEKTPGKEKWNYPIYAFTTSHAKRGDQRVEVRMNIGYSDYLQQEQDESTHHQLVLPFHYSLDLNERGEIVGGWYYNDSARIDLLWAALKPRPGGKPGNERGNPHVDIDSVLAIWRESVPEETRNQWVNIDPTPEDMTEAQKLAAAARETQAETASTDTASAETASAETASAETASAETASAETASAETASAETANAENTNAAAEHPVRETADVTTESTETDAATSADGAISGAE